MFYTSFVSASKKHVDWLQSMIFKELGIKGHITKSTKSSVYQLKYAKTESLKLLPKLYYDKSAVCLRRKYIKIERGLHFLNLELIQSASGGTW